MHASTVLLAVQGTLWGVMVYLLAGVAVGQQSNFVVAIALGLVSTPVLSAPFSIAIAFWLPVAIGGELAIAYGLKGNDHYLAGTILGYEVLVLVGIVVINRTLMQLSVARMKLKQQNQTVGLLLRDYEENAADWLWETDSDGRLRHITPRFAQVLRASPREIEGRLFAEVLNLGAANDADHETAAMLRAMARRPAVPGYPGQAPDRRRGALAVAHRSACPGAGHGFAGYRGVGSDITSAKRAAEETRYLATHDALTGIGNRRMFIDRLERACASRTGTQPQPFALLMLDLDRFKEVNDDHGHSSGDTVLLETACRIAAAMRPSDTVARLGGDEFALIMPNAGAREATGKAERLIEVISDRIRVDDAWLSVGASIGVALFPRDGKSVVEIMRNADLALYRAKEAGRGTCRVFEASFGVEFQDRRRSADRIARRHQHRGLPDRLSAHRPISPHSRSFRSRPCAAGYRIRSAGPSHPRCLSRWRKNVV